MEIQGANSEMKEARETRHELKEWQLEKVKRHEKRLDRQRHLHDGDGGSDGDGDRNGDGNGDGSGSGSRNGADSWASAAPPRGNRYDDGPHYSDGNPYAALPAPPVGHDSSTR